MSDFDEDMRDIIDIGNYKVTKIEPCKQCGKQPSVKISEEEGYYFLCKRCAAKRKEE